MKIMNRYGDTSFRLKNQIQFYIEVLSYISIENSKETPVNTLSIYNHLLKQGIIDYKAGKISNSSRGHMAIKQLKLFYLVQVSEGDKSIYCTDFGKEVIRLLNKHTNSFSRIGLNLTSIVFFYIMMTRGEMSKKFKSFVSFLFYENIKEIDEKIKNSFILDSFTNNKFIVTNDMNVQKISDEEIDQIIKIGELQKVIKFGKPLIINKTLPKLIKNIKDYKNILSSDPKLCSELKKIYNYYLISNQKQPLDKNNSANNEKFFEYIILRNKHLINDTIAYKKYQTVRKDYGDINDRWFTQIYLFQKNGKKMYMINDLHATIYKWICNNINVKLEEVINFCLNKTQETDYSPPFSIDQVVQNLKKINNNEWISLKEDCKLENISNATIYEYFVNLSFYLTHNKDMKNFDKWCNTSYGIDFKPIIHASGGKPDGYLVEKNEQDNELYAIVESTILERTEDIINKEKMSTQRHSYNHFMTMKKTKDYNEDSPYTVLVLKSMYNNPLIYNFATEEHSYYINDQNTKVKTIIINTENLIKLLELDKLKYLLFYFGNKLPFNKIVRDKCLEFQVDLIQNLINKSF